MLDGANVVPGAVTLAKYGADVDAAAVAEMFENNETLDAAGCRV